MPANRPNKAEQLERERRVWALRCRGKVYATIAAELGLSVGGVHKIVRRVEEREAKRLTRHHHRIKARQFGQLDFVIEESMGAWLKSKTPRMRATKRRTGSGPGSAAEALETHEVMEREGDAGYLYLAMTAMGNQRALYGLDVAAAQQESTTTVSELVADLLKTGQAYDDRKAAEAKAGDPPGDATTLAGNPGDVQTGSKPV